MKYKKKVDQYIGLMVGVSGKVSFNGKGPCGKEERFEEAVAQTFSTCSHFMVGTVGMFDYFDGYPDDGHLRSDVLHA